MEGERVFKKLNEVFKLIFYSKLKDDVDDALLEKLLSSVRLESTKQGCFVKKMIQSTQLEKHLTEILKKRPPEMDWEAITFSFQLLSVFGSNQDIINLLTKEKGRLLSQLMNVFQTRNLPLMSFSVKVAGLDCFTMLAKEEKQFLLLYKNGIVKAGIHCLAEESIYVQLSAIKFISTCMLTAQGITRQNVANENMAVEEPFELIMAEILALLHSTSEVPKCDRSRKLFMSATDVLKSFFEMKSEYDVTPIASIISNVIRVHLRETDIDEIYLNKLLELLSVIISPWKQNIYSLLELTESLLRKQQLSLLFHFLSSSIMRYEEEQLSSDVLDVFLSPMNFLSSSLNISSDLLDCLQTITKNKASTLKLLSFSILCLSNVKNKMNKEQQKKVLLCMQKVLSLTIQESEKPVLLGYIFGSQKLQLALLTFISSNLKWLDLLNKEEEIFSSMEVFVNTVESSSSSAMVTDKCMKIISRLIEVWHNLSATEVKKWDHPLLNNVAKMLQKRLLDRHWEVIDSTLTLITSICRCCKDAVEWLCSFNVHTAVWDMIPADCADYLDGYVKANALCTITSFLISPVGWEHLQKDRNFTEKNIILLFCKSLLCDSDTFVHREAVKAMSSWIQHRNLPEEFCKALSIAITSDLDWEVKILALETWKLILKQSYSLQSSNGGKQNTHDMQKSLNDICQSGFAFAITSALSDHDRSVQNVAARILSDMSSQFQMLKIENVKSDHADKRADDTIHNEINESITADEQLYSKESRESIIESVLDIGTDLQIYEKLTPAVNFGTDVYVENILKSKPIIMNVEDFLRLICSKDLKEILTESEKSTDLYEDNLESLLDDVLNSAAADSEHHVMDCY